MRYRACIFDMDGTLLNTIEDIAAAMNTALASVNCPGYTAAHYKNLVGSGIDMLIRRALPEECTDDKTLTQVKTVFRKQYLLHLTDTTRPYPGIPQLLDQLVKRNIKLAVLSNKPHEMVLLSVKRLLSGWPFQVLMGAGSETTKKPDPAGALLIADKLEVQPKQILFIGDSSVDIETARKAGMQPVAVTWGFRKKEELIQMSAEIMISEPLKLLQHL
jgi:phosphoglycolate phosphatase